MRSSREAFQEVSLLSPPSTSYQNPFHFSRLAFPYGMHALGHDNQQHSFSWTSGARGGCSGLGEQWELGDPERSHPVSFCFVGTKGRNTTDSSKMGIHRGGGYSLEVLLGRATQQ